LIGGLILTLIFAGQAHDASEANGVGFPFGEFRLNEGRYSCLSTTQTQSNTFYYWLDACLYIGDLRIGHDRETLERVLGTDSFEAGSPDARYFVYTLYENEDGEPETVVNIWYNVKGLAKVIQLSGRPNVDWSFSSIQLGNAEADVIERLGEPLNITPAESIDGTSWSYAGQPFSFEFVDGIVYSIRISSPREDR